MCLLHLVIRHLSLKVLFKASIKDMSDVVRRACPVTSSSIAAEGLPGYPHALLAQDTFSESSGISTSPACRFMQWSVQPKCQSFEVA